MVGDTFGRHDPYYYESFVGLTEVVKLLDPESSMISVSFQAGDIAKWDDVVVNLSTGGMRCYQVKHTREQNNINFSDLIKRDSKDTTFIRELFDASVSSGLNAANVSLILFTNRDAGKKKTSRADGEKRPPLLAFWSTLKEQLDTVKCFADFDFPSDQKVGWDEFVACFSGCEESEVVAFLKQMEIRTSEDEQENLESRIKRSLSVVFGASEDVNNALFNSLVAALRRWTTSKWIERHGSVTGEELYIALAVPAKPEEIGIAPPPPTPFFSSRIDFVNDLEKSIVSDDGPQTTFLTGEAGSGKTSCVSYLANRRTEGAFESVINARFFCFEPITPQKPFIDSDASKVTPKELWGTLLTQLRTLLRGRWFECKVPIRNSILTWQQAREHVIRLADFVGQEIGRRFVIAVDGIDHAARAKQAQPKQIRDFFNSIPSPDELKGKAIRLLIAGQPAEYYPEEYPTWLAIENESVEVITLPALSVDDILELFKESKSRLQSDQLQTAANLVFTLTKGNTLGVVFAVAESENEVSFDSWKESLEDRKLSGSLAGYYQSIWQSATANVSGVGSSIACAISMARKPVTPEQLTDAFLSWNKPVGEWRHILQQLKPLLEFVEGGYRVRHNDVRIFLARKFQSFAPEERQRVAGELADYYMTETSDRLSAHQTLFDLLKIANREVECAAVFDTDWVFEAVSVGMEIHELWREGIQAAQQLKAADNWDRVVSVACGLQTLNRISDDADLMPLRLMKTLVEPVLASESRVRPTDHWTTSIFSDVVYDIDKLCDGEEYVRARGLIERWFGGLSPIDVLHRIPVAKEGDGFGWMPNKAGLSDTLKHNFRLLGWLYEKLEVDWEFVSANDLNEDEADALFAFEEGFVDSLTSEPFDPEHLELLFTTQFPTYTSNLELATRNLADLQQWDLAGRLLDVLVDDEASNRFVGDACFFALKSNPKSKAHWLTPVSGQTIEPVSISLDGIDNFNQDDMSSLSKMCAAFGWVNDSRSPIQLMSQVFSRFDETELKHPRELQQIILASVCFGRLEHCATAKGNESAIPAVEIGKILKLLLTTSWYSGSYILASTLADQIAQHCLKLGAVLENPV